MRGVGDPMGQINDLVSRACRLCGRLHRRDFVLLEDVFAMLKTGPNDRTMLPTPSAFESLNYVLLACVSEKWCSVRATFRRSSWRGLGQDRPQMT